METQTNTLFIADPLDVLRRLDSGQFDLVFLDPPYYGGYLFDLNNPQSPPYRSFDEYLEYVVTIFLQSHRVLKQNGAVLLRINPLSPLNARLFLDRIFGKQNFRAEIIWENRPIERSLKSGPYVNFESVFFYSISNNFTYNEPVKELSEKELKLQYRHQDEKGYYKLWSLLDKIDRPEGNFEWNGIKPPQGFTWKYSKKRLDEFRANGEIVNSGKYPKRKIYLSEDKVHSPLGFVWEDFTGIRHEKGQNDQRLFKVIEMASNPGYFILDPFLTPISLGTMMQTNRNWIGVSPFEISTRDYAQFRSCSLEQIDRNVVQTVDVVDNSEIPQYLRRLVDAEARAVNPQMIIENSGQKFAFLAGINHYKDGIGDLNYCINDVVELGQTLESLGYQVKIIHDDMEDNNLIPLRSNIETELHNLTQNLAPEDTLYIHFSCHGTLIDDEAILLTGDTRVQRLHSTALRLADIIDIMKNGRARKLVLSLDVCHGGVEMGRAIIDLEFVQNVFDNAEGFVLIAASTAQQQAYEIHEFEHGLFTYYLIQGFRGEADFDDDGRITVDDIRNYTLDAIRRWNVRNGGRQEPTYRSEGIGEITLVHPQR